MESKLTILNLIEECPFDAHEETTNYIIVNEDSITMPKDFALFLIQKAQNPIKTLAKASKNSLNEYKAKYNSAINLESTRALNFKKKMDMAIRTLTIINELINFYCKYVTEVFTQYEGIEAINNFSGTSKNKEDKKTRNTNNKHIERLFQKLMLGTAADLEG